MGHGTLLWIWGPGLLLGLFGSGILLWGQGPTLDQRPHLGLGSHPDPSIPFGSVVSHWSEGPIWGLPAPSATFWVRSWPRVAVVPFGGSVPINCSRGFCPGLAVPPELSWALGSTAGPGGRRWRTFVLTNVTEWEPEPALCRAQCGDSSANSSTAIIVYSEMGGIGTGEGWGLGRDWLWVRLGVG